MTKHYFTIQNSSTGLYKEKGSKFLGFAEPVTSEDEIKEKLDGLKAKYHDARHHCYAYVLGADRKVYRANDDGEPNHSAGDPILGQLHSKQLTNVLVVVVRYFGGIKLGVGGLIHAYKTAAEFALANAGVVKKEVTVEINLRYPYEFTNEVMKLIHDFDMTMTGQDFLEICITRAKVGVHHIDAVTNKVQLLADTGKKIEFTKITV